MKAVSALGYAGLIPFVVLPLWYLLPGWVGAHQILQLYSHYSALILGFMAGALWPWQYLAAASLTARENTTELESTANQTRLTRLALLAVTFPVLSILALFIVPDHFLPLQAGLFALLRLAEYLSGVNRQYHSAYRRLRNQLTLLVVLSHLVLYLLQST